MPISRMSATSKLAQLSLFVVIILLPLASAQADPIVLSGGASIFPGGLAGVHAFVNVNGTNFTANVTAANGNFGLRFCSPQNPGGCTTANMGWLSSGGDIVGTVMVNGVTFPTDINNSLSLNFTSLTFVIPPELLSEGAFKITAPFSFTGGFSSPSLGGPSLVLTGQGTVTVFLSRGTVGNVPGIYLDEAAYIFGPTVDGVTVEAVPEPATWLLLVSGLAGTVLRLRKRAGQKSEL